MAKQTKATAAETGNRKEGGESEKKTGESEKKTYPASRPAIIEPEADIDADQMPSGDSAAGGGNHPMVATVEAAVTPEFEILEKLGKEGLEVTEMATMSLADGFRQFASESACYTQELVDRGYAFAGELRQAKSPVAAVQVQIDFARSTYVRLLDHFMRVSTLSWDLLRQACKPVEGQAAKVK